MHPNYTVIQQSVRKTFSRRGDGIDLRSTKGKLFRDHLLTLIAKMDRAPNEDELVTLRALVFQTFSLRAMEQQAFDRGEPLSQVYINLSAQLERGLLKLGIDRGSPDGRRKVTGEAPDDRREAARG